MRFTKLYSYILVLIFSSAAGICSATAQDFLTQEWVLDPANSHVYLQTEKKVSIIEKHKFDVIEGSVDKNGDASVRIDLNSIETNIDIRNVRFRFLLFETFKFPYAEITAKLDKSKLQGLATPAPVTYPLTLQVDMHGTAATIQTSVRVTRVGDAAVSVETVDPIVVGAETFGFTKGIGKLSESVGGIYIKPEASITFDLEFVAGSLKAKVDAARASQEPSPSARDLAAMGSAAAQAGDCTLYKVNASLLNISKDAGGLVYIDVLYKGDTVCVARLANVGGVDWGLVSYKLGANTHTPVNGWSPLQFLTPASVAPAPPGAAAAPQAPSTGAAATNGSGDVLRFDQPIPFGPFPVNGHSLKEMIDSVPLFSPVESLDEDLWKKKCPSCHKWNQARLCDQGRTYLDMPRNVLRTPHPFGGTLKIALMRWAKSGCQ